MVFVAMIGVCIFALIVFAQDKNDVPRHFPGNWTLGSSPYLGEDYKTLPVITTNVTNDARKGLGITAAGLKNTTTKTVSAVKFTWYILEDQAPDKVLLQGQTQLIAIPGGIQPGTERNLEFPVVIFSRVAQPLLREGALNGAFNIEALVSEVKYDDGTSWERTETRRLAQAKPQAGFVKASTRSQTVPCCAFQHCVWSDVLHRFQCIRLSTRLNCQPDQFGGQFQCVTSICPDDCGL